ncbi:actin-interacting protein (Bud6/Aip3), putative [Talaromyces stipitatus ATCC 10500]|uniref:Actin-interacting protein (Bud6/Aip3), putative n=1 Tax=Talaromyces stipitatus (strain ATCC 10500 / CBS 375.48 / QM 6759 / NRRL 1006) TaxID=441959 RepID=B8LVI6_TALSN|nr:actin-interacting protein (Bud6/Aip3), putative [Talaromyces stipitatus ATCC 10500]EED24005.1 actin-interacting protein (Bud6/Aip3), putative [Talaromyces stipitatus ATCC 10500]
MEQAKNVTIIRSYSPARETRDPHLPASLLPGRHNISEEDLGPLAKTTTDGPINSFVYRSHQAVSTTSRENLLHLQTVHRVRLPETAQISLMQSSHSLSRSTQRPSRADSPSTVSSSNGASMASQPSGPRSSSGSAQSHASRSGVPGKQISQIEASVTHLLVATKQLLETLTQWSRRSATENEVSDVYVRLGYEFNLACRAFGAIGVDTSDLGPVPDLLRTILEDTLSQDASPQSLDRYLPRHATEASQFGSQAGSEPGPSQAADEATPASPQKRPSSARRYGSSGSLEDKPPVPRDHANGSFSEREASRRDAERTLTSPSMSSMMTGSTLQEQSLQNGKPSYSTPPPPPPPPPKQDDALGALQRSGELERRASRRFSAYQIQKHLGTSSNGVPVLPTQTVPMPNRGRDVRESLNAVRLRGSYVGRQKSANRQESSPSRTTYQRSTSVIPEDIQPSRSKQAAPASEAPTNDNDSPVSKAPTDKLRSAVEIDGPDISTTNGSIVFPQPGQGLPVSNDVEPVKSQPSDTAPMTPKAQDEPAIALGTPPQTQHFIPEQSPSPGKELTLFLQYKSKIKKYVIPEGSTGLTIGRLQLAFIEKFAWNTQQNGVDLPEIYIQDPISGVRHELEDLSDVKDRSVLVLNVEVLDEVKRHFDDGIGSIRRLIEGVKNAVDSQETAMQRVSERQLDAAKEMARLAATPQIALPPNSDTNSKGKSPVPRDANRVAEIQSLRRDIAVLRQTYSNFSSDIAASMSKIRAKAGGVKTAAAAVATPSFEGDAGRARINSGKKELSDESERLVGRVDDLQDLVEDLRKDVVSRGVRPLPRQLEAVSKDISTVTKEVKKMQDFLKREKPIWTKIWEKELQLVCEERDQLTMQEDLAADLEDDLEKAAQTFALVEQATRQQNVQAPDGGPVLRSTSRTLAIDQGVDPVKAKDGVLGEVRALQPNHESRLEAIERAEKARQKELESRRVGLFQKELGQFVEEGKLKKSGGFEETERLRRAKDERIRKEVWERQQARAAAMEEAEKVEKEEPQATSPEDTKESDQSPDGEAATAQEESAQPDGEAAAAETSTPNEVENGTTEEIPAESNVV